MPPNSLKVAGWSGSRAEEAADAVRHVVEHDAHQRQRQPDQQQHERLDEEAQHRRQRVGGSDLRVSEPQRRELRVVRGHRIDERLEALRPRRQQLAITSEQPPPRRKALRQRGLRRQLGIGL
jgi:hypothetical protein